MSTKIQKLYSNDEEAKNKRKKMIRNSTYALIITFSIILGATLIAVNVKNLHKTSTLETAITTTQFALPLDNVTVIKDYDSTQLQYNDTMKQWEIHRAIDLTSETSTKVFAIASGTVTNVYSNSLEGTVIEISHENGLTSVYKSLNQKTEVNLGETVRQGQLIGNISNSMTREGNSGAHLHLELSLNNSLVDPNNYIDFSKK